MSLILNNLLNCIMAIGLAYVTALWFLAAYLERSVFDVGFFARSTRLREKFPKRFIAASKPRANTGTGAGFLPF